MLHDRVMSDDEINSHQNLTKHKLSDLNKQIGYHSKSPLLSPLTEGQFLANTSFESIWTLKELLDRCDSQNRDNWFCRLFRK